MRNIMSSALVIMVAVGAMDTAWGGVGAVVKRPGYAGSVVVSPADPIIGTPDGQEPGSVESVWNALGPPERSAIPTIGGPVRD